MAAPHLRDGHPLFLNALMHDRIDIVEGDITKLAFDGAIHRAAGPDLLAACAALGGCATGEAKITPGFNLPARYVIHTVGPVWGGGERGETRLLASCYRNSLALAREHGLASIAFPAISTGAYGFPPDRAARIAVAATLDMLTQADDITRVVFCCFGADSRAHHETAVMAARS